MFVVCVLLVGLVSAFCPPYPRRGFYEESSMVEDKLIQQESKLLQLEDMVREAEDQISFLRENSRNMISKNNRKRSKKRISALEMNIVAYRLQKDVISNNMKKTIKKIPKTLRSGFLRRTHLEHRFKSFYHPLEQVDRIVDDIVGKELH